jgi:hypothetical protein
MTHRDAKPSKSKLRKEEHQLWLEALAGRPAAGLEAASVREAELAAGVLGRRELKTGRNRSINPEVIAAQPGSRGAVQAALPNLRNKDGDHLSRSTETPIEKTNSEKEIIKRVMKRLEDKRLI